MTTPEPQHDRTMTWSGRRALIAVVAAALLLALVVGVLVWRDHRVPAGVAFKVGGDETTSAQLREEVAALRSLYGIEPPSGGAKLKAFWRDAAKASAVSDVLKRAAEKKDIVVPRRTAEKSLTTYINRLYGSEADPRASFVRALGNAGTSEPAVLREIRRQLAITRLYDAISGHVPEPAAAEVASAFAERGCSLNVPERRAIRNIVVASKSQASAVQRQLKAGTSFVSLAKSTSADKSTSAAGGKLGTLMESQLDPSVAKLAFAAGIDDIFGPVKSKFGWNVGQVTSITRSGKTTYPAVATPLRQALLSERRTNAWRSWLRAQIKDGDVRYGADYRPADPLAVPTEIGAASQTMTDSDGCPVPETGLVGAPPAAE